MVASGEGGFPDPYLQFPFFSFLQMSSKLHLENYLHFIREDSLF